MCTAALWNHSPDEFAKRFGEFAAAVFPDYQRLMIRPTNPLITGTLDGDGPHFEMRPFGVMSPELPVQRRVLNARRENLRRSPYWKRLSDQRRCVVVISGFFESRRQAGLEVFRFGEPAPGGDTAFLPSALAGLWDDTGVVVITRPAEGAVADIHDRMPAVLRPQQIREWLTATGCPLDLLKEPPPVLARHQVTSQAFKLAPDDPAIISPWTPPQQGMLF